MTELRLDTWTMPTADIGPESPLPPIGGDASLDKRADLTAASEAIQRGAGYGRVTSIAPYLMQGGYTRERSVQQHPVAILENDHLRATFLLGQGGRLWSLRHRRTDIELLYTNPIFQPANLALRSAWFAGGVEWNIGTIGHSPLTCAPMHAARITADDGEPVLRLYEFERLRRLVFQLDIHLPEASEALFVHVRVTNPNGHDVPMYWWSNIAVPQGRDTRVLAPADRTWSYSYDNVMRHDPVAPRGSASGSTEHDAALDISYPARFSDAADFFFDLDGIRRPWIAALQADGTGLFQTSTGNLAGRKLFRWGTSGGGRRWQEWLSGPLANPAGGYAEIQAGLAATQFEHLPMPAGAVWAWTEAYGRIALGHDEASKPWAEARGLAQDCVIHAVPDAELARVHAAAEALADRRPEQVLHAGSGWGALEGAIREDAGDIPLDLPGTPFPADTLGAQQQPWLELLRTGSLPDQSEDYWPASMNLHPRLVELLAHSTGWAAPALAGVAEAAAGDWDAAADSWQLSLDRCENAYAHRNLAVAAERAGDGPAAAEHYLAALRQVDAASVAYVPLVAEALAVLAGLLPAAALIVIDNLPAEVATLGRIRMLTAKAALGACDFDRCQAILHDPSLEVADLREGEESLDELYFACQTARIAAERDVPVTEMLRREVESAQPLPAHLDFRMKPGLDR